VLGPVSFNSLPLHLLKPPLFGLFFDDDFPLSLPPTSFSYWPECSCTSSFSWFAEVSLDCLKLMIFFRAVFVECRDGGVPSSPSCVGTKFVLSLSSPPAGNGSLVDHPVTRLRVGLTTFNVFSFFASPPPAQGHDSFDPPHHRLFFASLTNSSTTLAVSPTRFYLSPSSRIEDKPPHFSPKSLLAAGVSGAARSSHK